MELSVIIVNYNVKFFLEQCLYSVSNAVNGIDAEVFVVDNNSVDGSSAMVRHKFPRVQIIENSDNVGFAKANNQAIRMAKGEYILLLNPDTVVEENTFQKCISFMNDHPEAGALGPKMIDGKGQFLPESKRGLPTPEVAFYKIFGLTKLFPRSKRFGKYYLGHTRADKIQEVEVLTGAFMFIRKTVFEKAGLLDEEYFMYGEDIDFSHRIFKAGYKLFYFPETTIIHYKGESAKRGSLNYVVIFYKAMEIFARKHFTSQRYKAYSWFIHTAIYIRAILSILKRGFVRIVPVIADSLLSFLGIYAITVVWARFHFKNPDYYSGDILFGVVPVFIVLFVVVNFFAGGYKPPFNLLKVLKGLLYGFIVVLMVYALLPAHLRFSRAIIVFGILWMCVSFFLVRLVLSASSRVYRLELKRKRRMAIVGYEKECERIRELLVLSGVEATYIVHVFPENEIPSEYYSGTLSQLTEIIRIHAIDEVVFSARDITSETIIQNMKLLQHTRVDFKIASPESASLIGSNSKKSSGDLYVVKVNPEKRNLGGI